jgi:glycosyltransferase involved in cell wall biosynthesis
LTYVMHVITDLGFGGAEMMLRRLIEARQGDANYRHTVISLLDNGKVGQRLQDLGVEVQALGMRSLRDLPRVLWTLAQLIRASRPDVVQTWMYHSDLMGGLAARLAGNRHVIWGVRCTDLPHARMSTQFAVTLCALLSRYVPSVIVCCAQSARDVHIARGYAPTKMVVIPNGYDLKEFRRNPQLRGQTRAAFGFGDEDMIVGIVGRFDPQKDHKTFVLSAAALAAKVDRVRFLMVGRGIDSTNEVLKTWIAQSGCENRFVLAGERSDIPGLLAGLDVLCLSSSCGEGFPNVVCEAMAMGIPCVVTDAGDAAAIVSDTGIVVPRRDPMALAHGLQTMLSRGAAERSRLGELARQRIERHYSMEMISAQFENIYNQLAQGDCP